MTCQSLRGYATTLLVEDDMAYVTMGSALVVLDVTHPEQPCELGRAYAQTCYSGNPTLAKLPGGTYFLTPSDPYGIEVFDVSDCQPTYPSCSADPACFTASGRASTWSGPLRALWLCCPPGPRMGP